MQGKARGRISLHPVSYSRSFSLTVNRLIFRNPNLHKVIFGVANSLDNVVDTKGIRNLDMATQPKLFPPVGRCIYCDTADGPLSKEHVIPFGLGGNFILPRASCKACAKITSAFERTCLRQMYGDLRTKYGAPSRRPKKRPKYIPLIVNRGGEHVQIGDLSPS